MAKFKRLTMPTAKKYYARGVEIFIIPCKVNEIVLKNTLLDAEKPLVLKKQEGEPNNTFDLQVEKYMAKYCCSAYGDYVHFYIKEGDIKK